MENIDKKTLTTLMNGDEVIAQKGTQTKEHAKMFWLMEALIKQKKGAHWIFGGLFILFYESKYFSFHFLYFLIRASFLHKHHLVRVKVTICEVLQYYYLKISNLLLKFSNGQMICLEFLKIKPVVDQFLTFLNQLALKIL